jgi:hypothetical protein
VHHYAKHLSASQLEKKLVSQQLFISNLLTGQDFKSHSDFQLFEVHCNVVFPLPYPMKIFILCFQAVRVLLRRGGNFLAISCAGILEHNQWGL